MDRHEAYRLVAEAASAAMEGRGAFRDLIAASGALTPEALDACFDLAPYLAHVDAILGRAGIPRGSAAAPAEAPQSAAGSGRSGRDG
jgi:adenylosuccinate lyase